MDRLRIGTVPYLNAAPLTYGLESDPEIDLIAMPPVTLAAVLRKGELDAALVSVTEFIFHPEYDVLPDWGICSDGEVSSVFLAHQDPLEKMAEIHLDPASFTSVHLLQVLLQHHGWKPRLVPLEGYTQSRRHRNVLLIGNPAIEFRRETPPTAHAIWDLGLAWQQMTNLPFVYAAWAMNRNSRLERVTQRLQRAGREGQTHLNDLIRSASDFDVDFRQRYLGGHIHYSMGNRERAGLVEFSRRLATK